MPPVRWTSEPTGLRHSRVQLDNLALVPASLLPYKAHYQRLANQLPPGAVLIVLPTEAGPEREALKTAADRFLAKGHPVTTLSADEVVAQARGSRRARQVATPPPTPVAAPATQPDIAIAAAERTPGEAGAASLVVDATPAADSRPLATLLVGEVPPFTRELRLVRLDSSQHRARFSVLQWHPTLFAGVALVEVRGQLGTAGRARVLVQVERPELNATIAQLVRRRFQAGYQIADWQ